MDDLTEYLFRGPAAWNEVQQGAHGMVVYVFRYTYTQRAS